MAQITFSLKDGMPYGKGEDAELQTEVTLRELNAGDLMDARLESERVIEAASGPRLVCSPELLALNTLRRQVARIGQIQGPMSLHDLRKLTLPDLCLLERKADAMDAAVLADKLGDRGRSDQAPG